MKLVSTIVGLGILTCTLFLGAPARGVVTIALTPPPSCVPVPSGLVAWWPAEGNGTDIVGGNNATVPAGVTYANGEVGQGFNFDGSANLVVADQPVLNPTNAMTIECWVYPRAPLSPVTWTQFLVSKDAGCGANREYLLIVGDSPTQPGSGDFRAHVGVPGGLMVLDGATIVQSNTWYHVAETYDGATLKLYVNGNLDGEMAVTGPIVTTAEPVRMGGGGDGGCPVYNLNGILDEPTIYNRALSSNEIAAIYNAGSAGKCKPQCVPAPSGIVGWWPGESNTVDIVGGDNGTLSPSGATYAPGMVGQGFRLDGTNGYVQIPDSAALRPANVTAEAWVWLDPNAPTTAGEYIIFKRNTWTYLYEGYSLAKTHNYNGDGTYSDYFQFVATRDGNQQIATSTTVAQRGVWYHVAGTYDGNTLTIYVNGVAEGSTVAGFALTYDTLPVYLGTSGEPAPLQGFLAGIIDEASIYNRALGSNEIAAIYNAGSAGKCNDGILAPYIITPPASQSVVEGGEADLSVTAGGAGPLSYQWQFNGKKISGATAAALSLPNLHTNQAGNYTVAITGAGGSVTSSPAVITVVSQSIVVFGYSGSEKITTPGEEFTYGYSGEMFFVPATTNVTFVGWANISGKKQYWMTTDPDYMCFQVGGTLGRSYTVLGRAGSGFDVSGLPHLWSYIHTGQNTALPIATRQTLMFPNTFTYSGTHAYPDEQTGNMVLRQDASTYSFLLNNTQTANNHGQTVTDLTTALVNSLVKQGYKPQ
jgi:hypothetical protein